MSAITITLLAHITRDIAVGHAMGFVLGVVTGALLLVIYVLSRSDDDDRPA